MGHQRHECEQWLKLNGNGIVAALKGYKGGGKGKYGKGKGKGGKGKGKQWNRFPGKVIGKGNYSLKYHGGEDDYAQAWGQEEYYDYKFYDDYNYYRGTMGYMGNAMMVLEAGKEETGKTLEKGKLDDRRDPLTDAPTTKAVNISNVYVALINYDDDDSNSDSSIDAAMQTRHHSHLVATFTKRRI